MNKVSEDESVSEETKNTIDDIARKLDETLIEQENDFQIKDKEQLRVFFNGEIVEGETVPEFYKNVLENLDAEKKYLVTKHKFSFYIMKSGIKKY